MTSVPRTVPGPTRPQGPSPSPLESADRLLVAGRYDEARAIYERLAEASVDGVAVLRAALAAEGAGRTDTALRWASLAAARWPELPGVYLCLGNALFAGGRRSEAEIAFRRAIGADRSDVDALFRLGQCVLENQPAEAERHFAAAAELAPAAAEAHEYLGHARNRQGAHESAAAAFERAIELDPQNAELHKHAGNAWIAIDRFAEAARAYEVATRIDPEDARYWNNLAAALRFAGDSEGALAAVERSLELAPGRAQTLANAGNVHFDAGRTDTALQCFEKAVAGDPTCLDHRLDLARAQIKCHDLEAAETSARLVLFGRPDCALALECLASIRMLRGQTVASLELYAEALRHNPSLATPYYRLAREGRLEDLAPIERELAAPGRSPEERMQLHFAAGHVHERRGDFALAFDHFSKANVLKTVQFDPSAYHVAVDTLLEVFQRDSIREFALAPRTGPRPVFIVGMIRTGTTLLEQIVSSHPAVHGAGERPTLQRLLEDLAHREGARRGYPHCIAELGTDALERLRADYLEEIERSHPDTALFTDKTPTHFVHLGLIATLFPDAIVLHTRRDARDAVLSAYFLNFNDRNSSYAYDLDHLEAFHLEYVRLMQHWREHLPLQVLDVPYEELVSDTEAWTRRVLDHCGLPFDERCLRFHENERAVFTASATQVRQPTHSKSVGKWRRYAPWLSQLPERLATRDELLDSPGTVPTL